MRDMVAQAMDRIVPFLASLPEQRMHTLTGGKKLARWLREPLPEDGAPFDKLLTMLFSRVIPATINTASPGYLAYIPGGGLFHAAVADLVTLSVNRYVGLFVAAPGLVQLEANVISWFATMMGMPEGSGGLLTTGGSMANLTALVTARRERLPPDFLRGIIYASTEAHHSVRKAALIAGFPEANIREIATDNHFRMIPEALATAIEEDRAAGQTPFFLAAAAGTTNTGAVDDLEALAALAERERLWFHVDAAYGGFFVLTERGRATMKGISRADSITLDPHKSLFLPYGTGSLLVRDRESLRRAHAVAGAYMPPMQTEDDLVDFCEIGPELSRDSRGLRVWLPLKMHGAKVFRAELNEKLDLASHAAEALRKIPGVEIVAEPQLSLLAFRVRRPGMSEADVDALTRRVIAAVNERQRVFLTGAVVKGRYLIRICILSFRTHRERVDMALEDIAAAVQTCS
ncbi:MAG: aminotransferase class V-fold PLP-dependent enzyme [Byssovorax sp.]